VLIFYRIAHAQIEKKKAKEENKEMKNNIKLHESQHIIGLNLNQSSNMVKMTHSIKTVLLSVSIYLWLVASKSYGFQYSSSIWQRDVIGCLNVPKTFLFLSQQQDAQTTTISPAKEEFSGVTVGNTKGAALLLNNVAISRGSNRLLSNVNLRIEQKERWGIVGKLMFVENNCFDFYYYYSCH
jgi:ABC-type multidrug transport system fused ATPase/permease subunit